MKLASMLAPLAVSFAALAFAQPPKETKQPEIKAPAGWTDAEMQACMEAATPGAQHQILAKSIGAWRGKTSMWMGPGAEPISSECDMTVSDYMDGRFTKWEMSGDVPGMGPMKGSGVYGFDNVNQKFVASWVTNCGTNIMNGTGELSSDSKTFTWTYTITDPITKKPTTLRDIESHTGPDSFTLQTWGADSKSGKEYKMMEATFKRTAAKAAIQRVSDKSAQVACAGCVFHMEGAEGCQLAVKLDGKTYFVDGAEVAGHDWCDKALDAVVNGAIENGRFAASSVKTK